jgi:hypothetical protein
VVLEILLENRYLHLVVVVADAILVKIDGILAAWAAVSCANLDVWDAV